MKSPMLPVLETNSAPAWRVIRGSAATLRINPEAISVPERPLEARAAPGRRPRPPRPALDQVHVEAEVGEGDGAAKAGDPGADDQHGRGGLHPEGMRGTVRAALAIPARTRASPLDVAPDRSSVWAQEHCSRRFTWTYW